MLIPRTHGDMMQLDVGRLPRRLAPVGLQLRNTYMQRIRDELVKELENRNITRGSYAYLCRYMLTPWQPLRVCRFSYSFSLSGERSSYY